MNPLTDARRARHARRSGTVGIVAVLFTLLTGSLQAGAQLPPLFPPTTTTVPPPEEPPATTAPPQTTAPPPTTTPRGLESILGSGTTSTTAPPPPPAASPDPGPAAGVPGDGSGEGVTPPADAGEFPADLAAMSRSVRRSPGRNSRALLDALDELVELGLPREEALRVGMGRFPVAGYASYVHDWWFPRFGPGWRLHLGTDLFAPTGTPVRSPAEGTVRLTRGGLGGLSAYVVQPDGTYYYFAHLNDYAPGMADGHSVSTGDVIGYIGSTGNAAGGSPHLHFELHPAPTRVITKGKGKSRTVQVVTVPVRPGTTLPAVDPKAWLDRALSDALANVPSLVAEYKAHPELIPAPAPETPAFVPTDVVPAEGLVVTEPVVVRSRLVAAQPPIARVPLTALAVLLLVMVASLTPVYAPRRRLAGVEVPAPPPPPPPGDGEERPRRRRARRARKAEDPPAAADAPRERRRRRRRGRSGPEGGRRRRGRRGGAPTAGAEPAPASG